MVTKQEVAGRAGVSTATVGRVISGKGYVSAEARAKVNAAVKELNYRANKLASNLRKSKSNIIAVLVSRLSHIFMDTIYLCGKQQEQKNACRSCK